MRGSTEISRGIDSTTTVQYSIGLVIERITVHDIHTRHALGMP